MLRLALLLFLWVSAWNLAAQDDPCTAAPSTKAQKWIDKGTNKRKYDDLLYNFGLLLVDRMRVYR